MVHITEASALRRFDNIASTSVLPDLHLPHIAVERPEAAARGKQAPHRKKTASIYLKDP